MSRRFSPARLRAARRAASTRPEQLAVAIDRSVSSIGLYERGKVEPPANVLGALADALNCSIDDLFEVADV